MEPPALARALNAILPHDIRVLAVEEAAPGFHARFSATGKAYEYRIVNAPLVSPFLHNYVWHVIQPIDLERCARLPRGSSGRTTSPPSRGRAPG